MKNVKRLIALLMAATLIFSLSVSAFAEALVSEKNRYQGIVKVLDAEGKEIETAKVGDLVYIAVYFQKATDTAEPIEIAESDSSYLKYSVDLPVGMFAANPGFTESVTKIPFDATEGEATLTDNDDLYTIDNAIDVTGGLTINPQLPIDKHAFTLDVEGEFELDLYSMAACSDITPAKNSQIKKYGATLTVAAKQEATPSISTAEPTATEAGIAVEREDGTKFTYDNCYTVTVSMTNANDATKAGMQFIPKKVYENADNTWTGYAEVEFAADGLGAGERAYTAALINIPRKLAGQNIDMMARGFMVVDGKTLTGTVVESVVNYKVTPEPGQN